MKIPFTGTVTVVALLLLALATSGCESTPLLAPTGASLTLLASPVAAAEDANLDPTGQYNFSTIYGQLLDSGTGGTGGTESGTAGANRSSPLVGVSVTFNASGGNLRFNSCQQGVCSLDQTLCPGGVNECLQPSPEPLTLETDSAGVVQVSVAVDEDDPASITVTALSGSITQNVTFGNSLGAPNDEPEAKIGVSPSSPADASGGSVNVTFFSESSDPDGDEITCYEWTINSSTSSSNTVRGPDADVVTQTYGTEQSLDVLLRVTDDPDAASNCTADTRFSPNVDTLSGYLICSNSAPTASFVIGPPDTQIATVEFEVNGQASDDPETEIQTYQWDCDNGQDPTGVQTTCSYTRSTTTRFYEIELVVTDYSEESGCERESVPSVRTVTVPALGSP